MQKKEGPSKHRPKKEITEQVLARFGQKIQPQQTSTRKRLKKLHQVNPNEDIIEPEDTEKLSEDELDYQQFQIKDDEDLRREKEQEQENKHKKGGKGNMKLDSFLSKRLDKAPKSKKADQPKKVQLTLEEMVRIKKQQKKRRKSSDDFIVGDDDLSKERSREQDVNKLKQYNGAEMDEKKLIEKAMQLSLTAVSQKNDARHEPQRFAHEVKKEQKKDVEKRQQGRSKSKPKKAEERKGPLKDYVIAFTGQFEDYDKEHVIEVCMQLGADCPKSLTKKCNLLMQGAFVMDHFKRKLPTPINQTTKSREARERNIQIIDHQSIDNFFVTKTGYSLQHHLDNNKVRPTSTISKLFDDDEPEYITNQPQIKGFLKQEQKGLPTKKEAPVSIKFNQDTSLWTEKYRPRTLEDVVGQTSQIKQLRQWLEAWDDIHLRGNKRQVKENKGWSSGSINSKAALLSGDPGIGKTSAARLIAMELNFQVSEFNASDIRNKSGVGLMESSSFNLDIAKNLQKSLIIMDEVDGMSSGDRGGISAIIQMIKNSKVPIICICNDRACEKIRSLANHCNDIRFHKPAKPALVKRLKDILRSEGGSGEDRALQLLVENFQNDMRQILSYLQLIFQTVSKRITLDALSSRQRHSKDVSTTMNHFEASTKLLNRTIFSGMKISERTDCFFVDSDLVPLMVQENLISSNRKPKLDVKQFHSFVQGLEGIVIGDMIDRNIRKQQEWGLMPAYAFMSCVYAPEKISDSIGRPEFPSWLGKNSSERKQKRLNRQLKNAIFPASMCSSFKAVKNNYSSLIMHEITEMVKSDNIERTVDFMEYYRITPTLLTQNLTLLTSLSAKQCPLPNVSPNLKAKLTRTFNKRHEDSKLKGKKINKSTTAQHLKYDPVLEQLEADASEMDEESEVEEEAVKQTKKGKKKN